jgi:hypothetical protein
MKLFEKIYYECNLKPLYEQVLREMAVSFNLGLKMIQNLVVTDVAKQPEKVKTLINKLFTMDMGSNKTLPTFLNEKGEETNFNDWLTSILNTIQIKREKMYSNDLVKSTNYIRKIAEEIYNDLKT